jgi:Flp pilus assembly protein CpaB
LRFCWASAWPRPRVTWACSIANAPKRSPALRRPRLFEGITTTPRDVLVRAAKPEEIDFVNKNRDKLMPTLVTAVNLRTLQRNVMADELLLKEHFLEPGLPESISMRLEPDTRAVNVSVSKEKSLGGTVRSGEYVDVFLTSTVSDTLNPSGSLKTACIARQCKVVLKRDSFYTQLAATPEGVPVHYTLQANPYRAAFIEFAQSSGQLSLRPVPMAKMANKPMSPFTDLDSKEFKDDETRVSKLLKGELSIGNADLIRVFDLPPLKPLAKPTMVQVIRGTTTETVSLPSKDTNDEPLVYAFANPEPPSDKKPAAKPATGGMKPVNVDANLGQKKSGYVDPKKAPEKKGL